MHRQSRGENETRYPISVTPTLNICQHDSDAGKIEEVGDAFAPEPTSIVAVFGREQEYSWTLQASWGIHRKLQKPSEI